MRATATAVAVVVSCVAAAAANGQTRSDSATISVPGALDVAPRLSQGGVVYSMVAAVPPDASRDAGQITTVSADFAWLLRRRADGHTIDTIEKVRVTPRYTWTVNGLPITLPFEIRDEWTVLSDGTIAIARFDGTLEWIGMGVPSRITTGRISEGADLSDANKRRLADSALHPAAAPTTPGQPYFEFSVDKADGHVTPATMLTIGGPIALSGNGIIADSLVAPHRPAFMPHSALADNQGRMWIVGATVVNGARTAYAVEHGQVAYELRLPRDATLVAVGEHVVTVKHVDAAGHATFEQIRTPK